VQVSSHRGPPTHRPPDRPDRGRSVSGGCSQERANTRNPVVRLASSLSLAHSLSGKSAPFAAIANYRGAEAIRPPGSFFASRILSRSQSGAELDASEVWSVQGKRDTCVTNCHPSPNLVRNLFPVRRFSYHIRFSGFNRTVGRVTMPLGSRGTA
jgi:hypothetical protein